MDKFAKTAKVNGDPVHFTRALAMKAEVNARLGHFETAIDAIALLETIYSAEQHHDGICKAYGSDRSAQGISFSILWNRHLGRNEEGARLRRLVVEELLPKMDEQNVHNTVMLLIPVIKTMKEDGEFSEARHLFDTNVCQKFDLYFGEDGTTPCLSMFKPIMCLLGVLGLENSDNSISMPDLSEIILWAAAEDNGVSPRGVDDLLTSYGWSTNCLMAELCLELSKVTSPHQQEHKDRLQEKARRLASESRERMIDTETGIVRFPIAFRDCQAILCKLSDECNAGDGKQDKTNQLLNAFTSIRQISS